VRNPTVRAARPPQVLERDVRAVIANLANGKQGNAQGGDQRVRRTRRRAVGAICPVSQVEARHDPVVAAVLVDVADGHGGRGEAVHEDSFKFALREVDDAHEECEFLEARGGGACAVDERAREVHERVDQEGPEVFDDEDGAPGDLRACIC
jgi:hypothetical protein